MQIIIHSVESQSLAEDIGLRPGDCILAINGRQDLEDLLDYRFEVTGSAYLELHVRRHDGSEEIYEIEKDPEEDLGLHFESPLFTPIKTCNNACPFCFIDQQPEGLRPSLYVKDDDYRLSYFNNTYITLTNLTPHDRRRIETLRPGPLYISVHATPPAVRVELLKNKRAGAIMAELQWLKSLEIPFHCQIVVCPGVNDGDVLAQTLRDLNTLRPEALSVAVVPVGLTRYRNELAPLAAVDAAVALETVNRVKAFEREHGAGFVYLSDEFYFKAGLPLPDYSEYGDFPQLDDGVGAVRTLQEDFEHLEPLLPESLETARSVAIPTGALAVEALAPIVGRLNEIQGLQVTLTTVKSQFWGESVSVAGLITGRDLQAAFGGPAAGKYDALVIAAIMLKQGTDRFLDDLSVSELSGQLGLPVRVIPDAYSARALVETIGVPLKPIAAV